MFAPIKQCCRCFNKKNSITGPQLIRIESSFFFILFCCCCCCCCCCCSIHTQPNLFFGGNLAGALRRQSFSTRLARAKQKRITSFGDDNVGGRSIRGRLRAAMQPVQLRPSKTVDGSFAPKESRIFFWLTLVSSVPQQQQQQQQQQQKQQRGTSQTRLVRADAVQKWHRSRHQNESKIVCVPRRRDHCGGRSQSIAARRSSASRRPLSAGAGGLSLSLSLSSVCECVCRLWQLVVLFDLARFQQRTSPAAGRFMADGVDAGQRWPGPGSMVERKNSLTEPPNRRRSWHTHTHTHTRARTLHGNDDTDNPAQGDHTGHTRSRATPRTTRRRLAAVNNGGRRRRRPAASATAPAPAPLLRPTPPPSLPYASPSDPSQQKKNNHKTPPSRCFHSFTLGYLCNAI